HGYGPTQTSQAQTSQDGDCQGTGLGEQLRPKLAPAQVSQGTPEPSGDGNGSELRAWQLAAKGQKTASFPDSEPGPGRDERSPSRGQFPLGPVQDVKPVEGFQDAGRVLANDAAEGGGR